MLHLFPPRNPPIGASPGTLAVDEALPPPRLHVFRYDAESLDDVDLGEMEFGDFEHVAALLEGERNVWIDIQGLGHEDMMRAFGDLFGLHPLVLEDVVNAGHRPKVERYGDQLVLIARMLRFVDGRIDAEQVTIILFRRLVVTFQERHGDVLEPVRRRLRGGKGSMRCSGADYLAYAILDAIVDGYFPVLEAVGDRLEETEAALLESPDPSILRTLSTLRGQLVLMRRIVWPQREAIASLVREGDPLLDERVVVYLRDVHDHCVHTADAVESYRELVASQMSVYLSLVGNRTNEVMKVLTIMASIFIPLTFIVGVYGMNFDYMPELRVWWAYPAVMTGMGGVAVGLLLWFRHLGWIGRPPRR